MAHEVYPRTSGESCIRDCFYGGGCLVFSLKDFIKGGLIKAVGNLADYQVILNAAGWLEKGVLDENDLAEIQSAIDAKNTPIEPVEPEEPTDQIEEAE